MKPSGKEAFEGNVREGELIASKEKDKDFVKEYKMEAELTTPTLIESTYKIGFDGWKLRLFQISTMSTQTTTSMDEKSELDAVTDNLIRNAHEAQQITVKRALITCAII